MIDIGEKIKSYFSIIFTAVVIAVIIAVSTVVISAKTDSIGSVDFYIALGVGMALQISMIFVWLPEGKKYGQRNEKYKKLQEQTNGKIAKAAQPEMLKPLDDFCRFATEENRKSYVGRKVGRKYGINYSVWLDETEIGEHYRSRFDAKTAKYVEKMRIAAESRVREIKSTEITSGAKIREVYDVVNHEKSIGAVKVVLKLVWSIVSTFALTLLTFDANQPARAVVVRSLCWVFTIAGTIFFSIRNGIGLVVNVRADYFRRINDFLDHFDAWKVAKK